MNELLGRKKTEVGTWMNGIEGGVDRYWDADKRH